MWVQSMSSRWTHIVSLAGHLNLIFIEEVERGAAVRRCTYKRLFSDRYAVRVKGSHTGRALAITTIKVAAVRILLWIVMMSISLNAPESDGNVQDVP